VTKTEELHNLRTVSEFPAQFFHFAATSLFHYFNDLYGYMAHFLLRKQLHALFSFPFFLLQENEKKERSKASLGFTSEKFS
jgi:hypothetical protein